MKVTFGISFDGYVPRDPTPELGGCICGPLSLLSLLETRLGLKSKTASRARRIAEYRAYLDHAGAGRGMFYMASLAKDPYATAEVLLGLRDSLIGAGWDGSASDTDSRRLRDLAAAEQASAGRLSPGIEDRLRAVLAEAKVRRPYIDSITILDTKECLPKLWRDLFAVFGASYDSIDPRLRSGVPRGETDLAMLRQALLEPSSPSSKLRLRGDGSVLVVTAFSEFTLAQAVAQTIASLGADNQSVTLMASDAAGLLNSAFQRQDQPCVGIHPASTARPIPQVLALALRLFWQPLDPRDLLEFLTHPICPVASVLRRRLAAAVAESPGIGGPAWQEAVASARQNAEKKTAPDAAEVRRALGRIESDLRDWILFERFDPQLGAPGAILSETCARVAAWASRMASKLDLEQPQTEMLHATIANAAELREVVKHESAVTRPQLERLLSQVCGGWQTPEPDPQAGHVHRVRGPECVLEPADSILWWDFSEAPPTALAPWTPQETTQLRSHGAEVIPAEILLAAPNRAWLRPLFAARARLVLFRPRQRAREPVPRHPLELRLLTLLEDGSPKLPTLDLDATLEIGQSTTRLTLERMQPRALPQVRRWWKLSGGQQLGPRREESFSSADKFIFSPYAWVLDYKARLRLGTIAKARLAEDFRLKGTLLHRLLDLLAAAPTSKIDWRTASQQELDCWIERCWPTLLEQEGATFLLPGKRADGEALLQTGKNALWRLLGHLRQAGIERIETNVAMPPAPFPGGQMGGKIDLLGHSREKGNAVIDLKFAGRDRRQSELQNNLQLQLAVYAYLVQHGQAGNWPATAYYLLTRGELLAQRRDYFAGAVQIPARAQPTGEPACWQEFEQVWQWRREQLDAGWIELTLGSAEPTDGTGGPPGSTPPVARWAAGEDEDEFNVFNALTG